MLLAAVVLNFVTAALLALLGGKYLRGPAPADYHEEILKSAYAEITEAHIGVFRALNVVVGAGFYAQAVVIALVTYFGVWEDVFWAKCVVLVAVLMSGIPAMLAAQRLEKHTRVTTPWRPGIVLLIMAGVAFVLSVL
jgi:hypothetical protein